MPAENSSETGRGHFQVTQHDTNVFTSPLPRRITFGTAGIYVVTDEYGNDATYKVPAGYCLDLRCQRVKVSGSTPSNDAYIVGLR